MNELSIRKTENDGYILRRWNDGTEEFVTFDLDELKSKIVEWLAEDVSSDVATSM